MPSQWFRLLLCVALAFCGVAAAPALANPEFDAWADHFAAEWVRLNPELATRQQYFEGAEQAMLDRQLAPLTDAQRQRQYVLAVNGLARLDSWLQTDLSPAQRVGAQTMRWSLARTVDGERYADHTFVFDQLRGVHLRQVNLLTDTQPLRRAADVPAFLARLAEAPDRLDEAIARARRAAGRGLLPPRVILERARSQLRALLEPEAEHSTIVTSLARRTASVADLSPESRDKALAEARQLVAERMRPAWRRVLALLDELHPKTADAAGLWRFADGQAAYAHALSSHTTSAMTADEIHAFGLREVARIEAEMDRLLGHLGHHEGSIGDRVKALDAAMQPPAEPDPRPQLLQRYVGHVRDAQQRAQALFKWQPRAPVEVRRVPALTERTASAHYTTPAADGSLPGIFWVPLPGPRFGVLGMRTLAVHEAVPGHHFQLALQQEMTDLPRWRQQRIFGGGSAHAEGWALYAERLAIEQSWYDDDPLGLLGALNSQLFRARRLVVDTGLHAMRWTREQAIDYGISASEVERYMANPGQACAYMIGMHRILALREEAQRALGERFSLPDFHDVVLRTGSVPLDVLDEVVRAWVVRERRG